MSRANEMIVQVLEEGYQLKDRMLRPSRVVVSKHSDAKAGSELASKESDPEEIE